MWLLIFIVSVICLAISRIIKSLRYWKDRQVASRTSWPVFGNHVKFSLGLKSFPETVQEWYDDFREKRFNGLFINNQPAIILRDSDLINDPIFKDQGYFRHSLITHGNSDELTYHTITDKAINKPIAEILEGTLEIAERSTKHFVDYFLAKGNNTIAIETNHMLKRYVADCIRNMVYLEELNLFLKHNDSSYKTVAGSLDGECAKINTVANFGEIVKNKVLNPHNDNVLRQQIQHFSRNNNNNNILKAIISDKDCNRAIELFEDVLKNVATTTSFLLYELTINEDLLNNLQNEVDQKLINNNQLTFEVIESMTYLNAVVVETLRKWPTRILDSKVCIKNADLTNGKEKLVVEEGTILIVPNYALRRDDQFYKEPEHFEPERKQVDVKSLVESSLGSNTLCTDLSILLTKIFVIRLAQNFKTKPISKTQFPLELSNRRCNLEAKSGIWIGLQRRKNL